MWSILYSADYGNVYQCGPFASREEALAYAKRVNYTDDKDIVNTEFDIRDTHVYVMSPDHKLTELDNSDFE